MKVNYPKYVTVKESILTCAVKLATINSETSDKFTVTLSLLTVALVPIEFPNVVAYDELLQSKTIVLILPTTDTVILEFAYNLTGAP